MLNINHIDQLLYSGISNQNYVRKDVSRFVIDVAYTTNFIRKKSK